SWKWRVMFIKFIIYSVALYFIMKAVKIVVRYFTQVSSKEKPEVKQSKAPYTVDKRDIVEAEFEDISDKENE
nr:hypothetical protein [Melioribacteraceae bacterium]